MRLSAGGEPAVNRVVEGVVADDALELRRVSLNVGEEVGELQDRLPALNALKQPVSGAEINHAMDGTVSFFLDESHF